MLIIALTGQNDAALHAVCLRIIELSTRQNKPVSVLQGVRTVGEACAVCTSTGSLHGELWRVGFDEERPQLDELIDRWIDDSPDLMLSQVDAALADFLAMRGAS